MPWTFYKAMHAISDDPMGWISLVISLVFGVLWARFLWKQVQKWEGGE